MSLFDVFDSLPERTEKLTTITGTFTMPPKPKRVYPCHHCANNYTVVKTGDPARPATMVCDPCGLHPNDCTCERIPYANVP